MKKRDLKKIRVIYFKIFDLPSHQVLLTKDTYEDEYQMIISFFIEGARIDMKYGYKNEKKRDEMFDIVNEEYLNELVNHIMPWDGKFYFEKINMVETFE